METKGIAVIIPAFWGETTMGKVTLADDVPIRAIDIIAKDNYIGQMFELGVLFSPINTNQREVSWSVTSGGQYASITNDGRLTIKEGALDSVIIVRVASALDASISATKSIRVTYNASGEIVETITDYVPYTIYGMVINTQNNTYANLGGCTSMLIPLDGVESLEVGATPAVTSVCLVTNNATTGPVPLATGEVVNRVTAGKVYNSIPSDAKYLYVMTLDFNVNTAPEYVKLRKVA